MKNDPLVSALEETARDEAALLEDPRWDALAAGTLSEADHAELRALSERSPAARAMYQAFHPLGDGALDRATDRVHGALVASRARPAAGPTRSRWRRAVAGLGMAAAAAAVVLVGLRGAAPPSVPAYELVVTGGDRDVRSTPEVPAEAVVLGPRTRLEVTLRPEKPVAGPIEVRAAWIAGSNAGAARTWTPRAEVSGEGAARIELTRADLPADLPAGPCELFFAVGRPEGLPDGAGALVERARRAAGDGDGIRFLRLPVVVRDAAGRAP